MMRRKGVERTKERGWRRAERRLVRKRVRRGVGECVRRMMDLEKVSWRVLKEESAFTCQLW